MDNIRITPATITKLSTITSFSVEVGRLELFTSVTLIVNYYNEDKHIIDRKHFTLTGQDYLNWTNDDQYIIDYVAAQCNFIIQPPAPAPAPDTAPDNAPAPAPAPEAGQ